MADKTPPDEMLRTLQSLEAEWAKAGRSIAAIMPREMAGAFSLMARPATAISASTFASMAAATQAWGMWLQAWSEGAQSMQRAATPAATAQAETVQDAFTTATTRAKATADTLISDAKAVADEITKPDGVKSATVVREKSKTVPKRNAAIAETQPAKPIAISRPANPDDLKMVSGVGPKLEQVLNGLGIWSYQQITALTAAEIDWIEDYLAFKGRIERDDWQGQAERLAASVATSTLKSGHRDD